MKSALDAAVDDETDLSGEPQPIEPFPIDPTISTRSAAGVTLVQVVLRSTVAVDLCVRVANELAGPVLPPRVEGVPAPGWDADGFRGTISASGRLGIGYACPVSSPERSDADAVSIDVLGPADGIDSTADAATDGVTSDSDSVPEAIRSLGRARPPADVVAATRQSRTDEPTDSISDEETGREGCTPDAIPAPVETWLAAAEARIERAERLTNATAEEATAVLESADGVDALVSLADEVAADESALRTLASRADDLADRAAVTDAAPVVSSLSAAAEVRTDTTAGSDVAVEAGPDAGGER